MNQSCDERSTEWRRGEGERREGSGERGEGRGRRDTLVIVDLPINLLAFFRAEESTTFHALQFRLPKAQEAHLPYTISRPLFCRLPHPLSSSSVLCPPSCPPSSVPSYIFMDCRMDDHSVGVIHPDEWPVVHPYSQVYKRHQRVCKSAPLHSHYINPHLPSPPLPSSLLFSYSPLPSPLTLD